MQRYAVSLLELLKPVYADAECDGAIVLQLIRIRFPEQLTSSGTKPPALHPYLVLTLALELCIETTLQLWPIALGCRSTNAHFQLL